MTSKTKTRKDFPAGTRCRLETSRYQLASTGIKDLYIHVGATPYVTGVISQEAPGYYHDLVIFRPDGWPHSEETAPTFLAQITKLSRLDEAAPSIPCRYSTGAGQPITHADVQRLVNKHLQGE